MTALQIPADTEFRLQARDLWQASQQFALSLRVPLADILGLSRKMPVVRARHAYWHWLYDHHGLTYQGIGRLLARDHTTIMCGVDKHLNRQPLARKPAYRGDQVVAEVRMVGWDRASLEEECEGGSHVYC